MTTGISGRFLECTSSTTPAIEGTTASRCIAKCYLRYEDVLSQVSQGNGFASMPLETAQQCVSGSSAGQFPVAACGTMKSTTRKSHLDPSLWTERKPGGGGGEICAKRRISFGITQMEKYQVDEVDLQNLLHSGGKIV